VVGNKTAIERRGTDVRISNIQRERSSCGVAVGDQFINTIDLQDCPDAVGRMATASADREKAMVIVLAEFDVDRKLFGWEGSYS
jgi:hypothetical protein